ncbi:hypothetical protein GOV04_01080 [Candidatus Woesearchaeota archaeon]|nr:hypothetical protein [Candidatus Woesearchaeota archaeon]
MVKWSVFSIGALFVFSGWLGQGWLASVNKLGYVMAFGLVAFGALFMVTSLFD